MTKREISLLATVHGVQFWEIDGEVYRNLITRKPIKRVLLTPECKLAHFNRARREFPSARYGPNDWTPQQEKEYRALVRKNSRKIRETVFP